MILSEDTIQKFGYTPEQAFITYKICCQCDYCNIKFDRKKRNILLGRTIIQKDSCDKCVTIKRRESQETKLGPDYKKIIGQKAHESLNKKYGCNPCTLQTVKDKIKATCKKKYGKESYLGTRECVEKTKKTSREKYGAEHPSQAEVVKQKIINTNKRKYGKNYFAETKEYKEKIKKTCQTRYGVNSVMQVNEFKEKAYQTNLEKYGVRHVLQNKQIKQNMENTCLERYGVQHYSKTPEYQNKRKKTCIEKYGVESPLQHPSIMKQMMKTRLDKYGKLWVNLGKTEQEIKEWMISVGINHNGSHILPSGKEVDIIAGEIGIEYCGLFWHNELSPQPRDRLYHYNKYKECIQNNIRLITIFEDEWDTRQEQCKDFLLSTFGIFEQRIYGRQCDVQEITNKQCKTFCEAYHIQGGTSFKHCFGLYHKKELVAVLGLSKHHRSNDTNKIILNRLCFKHGIQIIGGASKIFYQAKEWATNNGYNGIISWSDNRWSQGNIYTRLGFVLDGDIPPDYSYVNCYSAKKHRTKKQSVKKKDIQCPSGETESKWMLKNGFARIWDCGKKRWVFNLSQ